MCRRSEDLVTALSFGYTRDTEVSCVAIGQRLTHEGLARESR